MIDNKISALSSAMEQLHNVTEYPQIYHKYNKNPNVKTFLKSIHLISVHTKKEYLDARVFLYKI